MARTCAVYPTLNGLKVINIMNRFRGMELYGTQICHAFIFVCQVLFWTHFDIHGVTFWCNFKPSLTFKNKFIPLSLQCKFET